MLTLLASWLLIASAPLSPAPAGQPSSDDCEDTRRIELSSPVLTPPRICISPGTLTGLIFEHPVAVELQDEIRFVEVIRGRAGIAFIPPRDLRPGETLRLTATTDMGETNQNLAFVLVAHPGRGTHQIEVSFRPRSWQSLADALNQALLANQELRTENAVLAKEGVRLRAQLAEPTGLSGAFSTGLLSLDWGVSICQVDVAQTSTEALEVVRATSYRGISNIAVLVMLVHQTPEPWILESATLVNAQGEMRQALRYQQAGALSSGEKQMVFVEFDFKGFALGSVSSLRLTGTGGRAVTLTHVVFP
ncbi:MAG: DUF2381 family protein [Cystobacter sp.]